MQESDNAAINNYGHACVFWFTGLSGAGKSTLANAATNLLNEMKIPTQQLDGDILRQHYSKDLGFSSADRTKNIRRAAEAATSFVENGFITLAAFMSPRQSDRDMARAIIGPTRFIEIYCQCALEICEQRDTKGLYEKARRGEISHVIGIHDPYEEPTNPNLIINTGTQSLEQSRNQLAAFLQQFLPTNSALSES